MSTAQLSSVVASTDPTQTYTTPRVPLQRQPEPAGAPHEPAGRRSSTCVIRPTAWQARHAYRFVSGWLEQIGRSGPAEVVIDLSDAQLPDYMSFGLLFAKCRDVLRTPVVITGARPYVVETLRGLDLLGDACVEGQSADTRGPLVRSNHRPPHVGVAEGVAA